jgi:hypothetical protein
MGAMKRVTLPIPGITVTDLEALKDWMESDEHNHHCNAWNEGLCCCLDRLTGQWVP